MSEIKKSKINPAEFKIIEKHLRFINHITQQSIKFGYRAIVSGGYAVDGSLGEITRTHNDVDVQIYGKDVMTPKLLEEKILQGLDENIIIEDHGRSDYYHNFYISPIGIDLYYLRVATKPFSDSKIIVRANNSFSQEHDFETKMVILNGVRFEVQSPTVELVDKIFKRDYHGDVKQSKHDQDIYNLRKITDQYDTEQELEKVVKRWKESQLA